MSKMADTTDNVPSAEQAARSSRIPSFSAKERIVLLVATVVVIGGTAAAALSPNRSSATAAPGTTPVVAAAAHACPSTATAEFTASQPAALVAVSATGSAGATNAPTVSGAAATRSTSTGVTKKSTATKKAATNKASIAPATTPTSLVSVGTLVSFGSYGGAPLRWRVLDADASGVLLLSEFIVSAGAFQSDWEGRNASVYSASEIRTRLKGDFAAKAFDTTQTAALLPHSGGAAGSDRVFLLSAAEAARYLPKAANRRAAPGTSAGGGQIGFSGQALTLSGPYAAWWLADAASNDFSAQVVGADGKLGSQLVYYSDIGVRPAIRISRDKIGFTINAAGGN